jgi:hypothetical protein
MALAAHVRLLLVGIILAGAAHVGRAAAAPGQAQ